MIEIVSRFVSELVPYDKNPRKISDEAINAVAESIQEFGFKNPILIDKNNVIIAGHTRRLASLKLGLERVPCVVVDDLTPQQIKALRLADNKTNELAEWDIGELDLELEGLLDMDMERFGFDSVFGIEDEVEKTEEKNEQAEQKINEAWRQYCKEYTQQFDKLAGFTGMTEGYAKIKYLEAKYYGKEYPRNCSVIFQEHQFKTSGDLGSAYDGLLAVSEGTAKPERVRFVAGDNLSKLYSGSLAFSGYRMPLDFPVSLVRSLLRKYAPNSPNVLDPCHGWGGRLIGCMLEDVGSYTGIDPSNFANQGLKKIERAFREYSQIGDINIISSPFEDAEIKCNYYDFALTSPPYFDVEHYIGGEQSHEKFGNYDAWRDGFYSVLIKKVFDALKNGAYFCLQVGSQRYPLAEDGREIASHVGFAYEGTFATEMTNSFNETEKENGEVVLLLHKPL